MTGKWRSPRRAARSKCVVRGIEIPKSAIPRGRPKPLNRHGAPDLSRGLGLRRAPAEDSCADHTMCVLPAPARAAKPVQLADLLARPCPLWRYGIMPDALKIPERAERCREISEAGRSDNLASLGQYGSASNLAASGQMHACRPAQSHAEPLVPSFRLAPMFQTLSAASSTHRPPQGPV